MQIKNRAKHTVYSRQGCANHGTNELAIYVDRLLLAAGRQFYLQTGVVFSNRGAWEQGERHTVVCFKNSPTGKMIKKTPSRPAVAVSKEKTW